MKQNKEKYDFRAFGQAIKATRKGKGHTGSQRTGGIALYEQQNTGLMTLWENRFS